MLANRPYAIALVVLGTACATSVTETPNGTGDPAADGAGDAGTKLPGAPDGDPNAPHALGTITLGEGRESQTGDSTPVISASFFPDAKMSKTCTRKVGACEMTDIPKCMTGTTSSCAADETCTFDDACLSKCVKRCTKACPAADECTFTTTAPPEDMGMACTKRNRFDAGAIAFAGTTEAVTLFPPYTVKPTGNGAPFLAQSEIHVQATGAVGAGFQKFDEKFMSTTFLETDPPLAELGLGTVWSGGDVPIGWRAGQDTVFVTVAGSGGSAKCAADDKSGKYAIGRDVISAVTSSTTGAASSLSITVTRERREVRKDKKTTGSLAGGQTVQPVGWLELVTSSSESHAFASCGTGVTICSDTCVNLQSDARNCGTCGHACATTQYCSLGTCH